LPTFLNDSDKAEVNADEAEPNGLRVHIDSAGRTGYTFDFSCLYVDSREVNVTLVDVEKDGRTVDEHHETIQHLAEDYIRHLHECAQSLHELTHG
jgi:hypothetical protein